MGRVALIAGAADVWGQEVVRGLARCGDTVIALTRNPQRLDAAFGEIDNAVLGRVLSVVVDTTDRAALQEAMAVLRPEGIDGVDLLVLIPEPLDLEVPILCSDPDQSSDVIANHIRAAQLLVAECVPGMVARGCGRVVSLEAGSTGRSPRIRLAQSVGRSGVAELMEILAAQLEGTGVDVFNLAPASRSPGRPSADWAAQRRVTGPSVEEVVNWVLAIAAGELDQWSGHPIKLGWDDVDSWRVSTPRPAAIELSTHFEPPS